MLKDKVISISDLRTNATKIINSIPETGDKYVFVHNKPKAVLVDVDWFETVSEKYNKHGIEFIQADEFEKKSIQNFKQKNQTKQLENTEAFSFLEWLK